jgi:hypothetical protein
VEAWQQDHVTNAPPVTWLPVAVNLLDDIAVEALEQVVNELQPVLVVIDTLARCIIGGDENSSRDIGRAVEAAERLRRTSFACVLFIHHTGKDESAGARGSSALRAAVSTEIECRLADDVVTVKETKQRDRLCGVPVKLQLVPIGASCVLQRHIGDGTLPTGAFDLLTELAAIADAEGVSSSVWKASSGVAERSFYRWQQGLVAAGYCHKLGSGSRARYALTDLGKETVTA